MEPTPESRTWSSLARKRAVHTIVLAVIGTAGLLRYRPPVMAWVFLTCAVATAVLVPWIARWAMRRRILSLPGGRDRHHKRTPRAGGIALFIPVALVLMGMGVLGDTRAWGLLGGSAIVFTCGLVDDLRRVRPLGKILCQLAAGAALLLAGFRLEVLTVPGLGSYELGLLEVPTMLFWVVLVCNAVNLSDGLDGLATSLTLVGLAVLVAGGVQWMVPIALAGTCLGFLHYNWPRARIFLGDSGSLLLGFLLAALAFELPTRHNLPFALAACAYPLGDAALAVMRRFARGKPLFAPDASHVHHKVVEHAWGPRRALFVLLIFATLHGAFAFLWPGLISITASGLLWLLLVLVLARLASFRARDVIQHRRPMRKLHALRRYVAARLEEARSREDVARSLQHFVEGMDLCSVSFQELTIVHRDGCCELAMPDDPRHGSGPCRHHVVRMMVGRAAWRGPDGDGQDALRRERESVIVGVLRDAHGRLEDLAGGAPEARPG